MTQPRSRSARLAARPARATIRLRVDGRERVADAEAGCSLQEFLRLGLGVRTAAPCPHGSCEGACAVLVNGVSLPSCSVSAADLAGCEVVTPQAAGPEAGLLPALRAAVARFGVPQCGRCLPGILSSAAAWLARAPNPTEDELRAALAGHRCACGAFDRTVEALLNAGVERRGQRPESRLPSWE